MKYNINFEIEDKDVKKFIPEEKMYLFEKYMKAIEYLQIKKMKRLDIQISTGTIHYISAYIEECFDETDLILGDLLDMNILVYSEKCGYQLNDSINYKTTIERSNK